jgi:hypothetical protein
MSNYEIDKVINSNSNKLSIKEICDITGKHRNTVQRHLDRIGYDYIPHKKTPWNKGLTNDNPSVQASADKRRGLKWNHTDKAKQKIAEAMKDKGGVREFGGTGNKYHYGTDPMNSDFMLEIAQQLDKEGIKWNMDNRSLPYNDNGITRFISVDFYLEGYNIYLPVKYHIQNDTRKKIQKAAKENNVKILIIDEMLYRRIKYTNIKDILNNVLNNPES